MPYITLNETRFFYRQTGAGPDVVLVHAVTGNLAVWMFIGIMETLAEDFRVTAYDLRGHGGSDVTPTGYTSAEMAEDFRGLHEALGLGPALLVGHSYGGVVAMHTAALYPELVSGVIVADSYFPGLAHIEPELAHAGIWQDLRGNFAKAGADLGDEVDFSRLFRVVEQLSDEQKETLKREMGPSSLRWLSQLPLLAETSCGEDVMAEAGLTAERLASIQQPVVALYDEHSPFQATCRYLVERLPDCTAEIVPGANHIAPLQNSTGFVQTVQKHLRRMQAGLTEKTSTSR